jgi:hypothetical protein
MGGYAFLRRTPGGPAPAVRTEIREIFAEYAYSLFSFQLHGF